MKHLDEFRNSKHITAIVSQIHSISQIIGGQVNLMEVCGTHTMAIGRAGIRKMLPENINLISGPGCPVCVTPNSYIDGAIKIAKADKTRIVTFGDMYRVPSGNGSLEKAAAQGARIDIVYSPLDGLEIAKANPHQDVIFLAVGFETTAPLTARIIRYAQDQKINNFSVFSCHKLIPPAMEALVNDLNHTIHGFICPGHVSVIIGSRPYEIFPREYGIGCVISGFEITDILHSILILLEMIAGKRKVSVEIQYSRCVQRDGNTLALNLMKDVFDVVDAEWRGIGVIKSSGLEVTEKYSKYNSACRFEIDKKGLSDKKGCICGQILKGLKKPYNCRLFAKQCTPEHPVGPCMVSSEGTCAAYYAYER
ncbi:MAG: hydrogenase formation protein HypD [Candidatus Omnitrophica bacterium]|nr:hydrogenase formation protein HypD [Candidatus Omnitrophota bacterium]MCM8824842.1 hydrogenase formation protein HypD [Candidatus Omnitrophota bacterium]